MGDRYDKFLVKIGLRPSYDDHMNGIDILTLNNILDFNDTVKERMPIRYFIFIGIFDLLDDLKTFFIKRYDRIKYGRSDMLKLRNTTKYAYLDAGDKLGLAIESCLYELFECNFKHLLEACYPKEFAKLKGKSKLEMGMRYVTLALKELDKDIKDKNTSKAMLKPLKRQESALFVFQEAILFYTKEKPKYQAKIDRLYKVNAKTEDSIRKNLKELQNIEEEYTRRLMFHQAEVSKNSSSMW